MANIGGKGVRIVAAVTLLVAMVLVSAAPSPAAAGSVTAPVPSLQSSPTDGPPVEVTFADRSRIVLRIGPITTGTVPYSALTVFVDGTGLTTRSIPAAGSYPYVWVTHARLAPGTTYDYAVSMANSTGRSARTLVSGQTEGSIADNDLDLRVTRTEARRFVLNWRSPVVPTSYDVTVTGPDGLSRTTSITGTWFVVDWLQPETEYRISVQGQTSDGVGGFETVTATTSQIALRDPQPFLRSVTIGGVILGWPQRPGIDSYDIFRDGELLAARTTQASGYNDFSVEPDTEYVYQVREVSNGREGPLSAPLSARSIPDPFQATPDAVVTYTDRSTIVLRVGPVSGVRNDLVRVSLDGVIVAERPAPFVGSYPFVWFNLTGLEAGTTYSYDVQAVGFDGRLGLVNTVEVTTRP